MLRLKQKDVTPLKLQMLKEQGWCCALCNTNLRMNTTNACLDHDHKTGQIRGVLCRNCNRGEGKVLTQMTTCKRGGTEIAWLMNLLKYLLHHQVPQTKFVHPTHKTDDEKREIRNRKARERRKAKKNE